MKYDVVIIGAGVSGSAIARELSRYQLKTLVIEKEEDVCCGTSKANSGIVHAGFDAENGSLMAKLNVEGNQMMPELSKELRLFRRKLAGLRGVPAFLLFSDRVLEQLVRELPRTEAKLSRILGEKTRLRQRDKQKMLNIIQKYWDLH